MTLQFFPGLHQPSDGCHFAQACISINRLTARRKPVGCDRVFVDSGAFTILDRFGGYPEPVEVYASQLHRLHAAGVVNIAVAAAQDYMCEPFMLAKTGLTIADHQRLTIERYDALVAALLDVFEGSAPFPVMPVLQGFSRDDYVRHIAMYGDRLEPGMWVGVGSVCKRQGDPALIEDVLSAIKEARPDLRLHGFWREADGASESAGAGPAVLGGFDGLEPCRPTGGTKSQRLARGGGVCGEGQFSARRLSATSAFLSARAA